MTTETTTPIALLSFEELKKFKSQHSTGEVTADQVKTMWERFKVSEATLKEDLGRLTKKELIKYCGAFIRESETKKRLIDFAHSELRTGFAPGRFSWSYGENQDDVIDREVAKWTDELIQEKAAARRARIEALKTAVTDPQTMDEFETFLTYRKLEALTAEQLVRYDALLADAGRSRRQTDRERQAAVERITLPEGVTMSLTPTQHTQTKEPLWVVKLSEKVDSEMYKRLNVRAKKLGGYYSSYRFNGAVPGFQFRDEDSAQKFMSLEWVDGSERVAAKLEDRKQNAVDRLTEQADTLRSDAEERMGRDRKENTDRRARMAASIELDARRDLQLADTMTALAEAIASKEVKYVDYIITKSHVVQLEDLLRDAYWTALRAEGKWTDDREMQDSDIDFAVYPTVYLYPDEMQWLVRDYSEKSGMVLHCNWLKTILKKSKPEQKKFYFHAGSLLDRLEKILDKAKPRRGVIPWSLQSILLRLQQHDRLYRMNITNSAELRTALREYIQYRGKQQQADPIKKLLRELVGVKIPNLHPTPPDLALRMAEELDIQPGHVVGDTSAGLGNLADAVARVINLSEIELWLVEINPSLCEVLTAKNYEDVVNRDSLEYSRYFDRLILNPPFSEGQDIDHIRYWYDYLKPDGRMVAIMSEGAFFRSDSKAKSFREWLEKVGGSDEKLPEGTFIDSERSTRVNVRLVIIDK